MYANCTSANFFKKGGCIGKKNVIMVLAVLFFVLIGMSLFMDYYYFFEHKLEKKDILVYVKEIAFCIIKIA